MNSINDDDNTPERRKFHKDTAKRILEVAACTVPATPGGHKRWIASIAAGLNTTPKKLGPLLVKLHQRGLITLSRCDLVAAFDSELVKDSEIKADGATFHFVSS